MLQILEIGIPPQTKRQSCTDGSQMQFAGSGWAWLPFAWLALPPRTPMIGAPIFVFRVSAQLLKDLIKYNKSPALVLAAIFETVCGSH